MAESRTALAERVRLTVQRAFAGVELGHGISLRKAEVIDGQAVNFRPSSELQALKGGEVTNDWSAIPLVELERDCIAHLDAAGLRYYLPALMLLMLSHYESRAMWVVGTFGSINVRGKHREHTLDRLSLLSSDQRAAVALWLAALPHLVDLQVEHRKIVERATTAFWTRYLPAQ